MTYNGLNGKGWSFFGSGGDAFNIVKFFLGIITLIFDIIFLTQCYIIYRNPTNDFVEECEEDVDYNKKSSFLSSSSQISSKVKIS